MKKVFQMPFSVTAPDVRYRVDTRYGYISYGSQDYDKALKYFQDEGIRLRLCKNIFDDGHVIAGEPLPEDPNGRR